MIHPLVRALGGIGVEVAELAVRLGVDPKTAERWLAGRVPYPRHRAALVELTGWTEHDLWPTLDRPASPPSESDGIRVAYPHRSAMPADEWRRFFASATHHIDVLAYSALFLAEDDGVQQVLSDQAGSGVRVRLALGHPAGKHVVRRAHESGGTDTITRIHTALILFGQLASESAVQLRLHDAILYSSIYRADDDLLINVRVYGCPASQAPVLRVRRTHADSVADTYLASFERIWSEARDVGL